MWLLIHTLSILHAVGGDNGYDIECLFFTPASPSSRSPSTQQWQWQHINVSLGVPCHTWKESTVHMKGSCRAALFYVIDMTRKLLAAQVPRKLVTSFRPFWIAGSGPINLLAVRIIILFSREVKKKKKLHVKCHKILCCEILIWFF